MPEYRGTFKTGWLFVLPIGKTRSGHIKGGVVMTHKCVADDQYGQLWRRLEEVARRVREGTIPFDPTMTALQKVVEGMVQQTAVRLFVDYTRPLANMIKEDGRFDWVNSDITEKHFPITKRPNGEVEMKVF